MERAVQPPVMQKAQEIIETKSESKKIQNQPSSYFLNYSKL